jgi:hypothetical protein
VCPPSCFFACRAFDESVWRAGPQLEGCLTPQTLRFGWPTSIFLGFHRGCTSGWLQCVLGGGVRGVHASHPPQGTQRQASSRPAKRHQQPSHAAARYTPGPIQLLRRSLVVRERCCSWAPRLRGCAEPVPESIYHYPLTSAAAVVLAATPSLRRYFSQRAACLLPCCCRTLAYFGCGCC